MFNQYWLDKKMNDFEKLSEIRTIVCVGVGGSNVHISVIYAVHVYS